MKVNEAHATYGTKCKEAGLMLKECRHLIECHTRIDVGDEQRLRLLRVGGATAGPHAASRGGTGEVGRKDGGRNVAI